MYRKSCKRFHRSRRCGVASVLNERSCGRGALKTTPLFGYHKEHAKLTEFAGYEMPLWYTATSLEHMAVRNASGVFDVSHMGRVVVRGKGSLALLEAAVPTEVARNPPGKAFYTLFLNDDGGILDDLIVTRLGDREFMVVVNAANRDADLAHLKDLSPGDAEIEDLTDETAMLAVQGPKAQTDLQPLVPSDLGLLNRFRSVATEVLGEMALISRTGYTGEDGFEVIIYGASVSRPEGAMKIWQRLTSTSTIPCGLSSRDSLRLEAGYPLHGQDISERVDPLEADLGWVLSPEKRGFVGEKALSEIRRRGTDEVRRGLVLDQGIPRHSFEVLGPAGVVGTVTSGTFSPVLRKGIALCLAKKDATPLGSNVEVSVRDSRQRAKVVRPPFYDEDLFGWRRKEGK
jgi:glycine cleavage system T protein (aminomethyltransferase)